MERIGLGLLTGFLFILEVPFGGIYSFWLPYFSGFIVGSGEPGVGRRLTTGWGVWAAALGTGLLLPPGALLSALATGHADHVVDRLAGAVITLFAGAIIGALKSFKWTRLQSVVHVAPSLFLVAWLLFSPLHQSLIPPSYDEYQELR